MKNKIQSIKKIINAFNTLTVTLTHEKIGKNRAKEYQKLNLL